MLIMWYRFPNTKNDSTCDQLSNLFQISRTGGVLPRISQLISNKNSLSYMQLLVVLTALESRVIEAASNDTVSTYDNDDDNLYSHHH